MGWGSRAVIRVTFTAPLRAVPFARMTEKQRRLVAATPHQDTPLAHIRRYLQFKHDLAAYALQARLCAGNPPIIPKGHDFHLRIAFEHAEPTFKPDLSNCVKAVEDAMQGVLYANDQGVRTITASRQRSSDRSDRIVITVEQCS